MEIKSRNVDFRFLYSPNRETIVFSNKLRVRQPSSKTLLEYLKMFLKLLQRILWGINGVERREKIFLNNEGKGKHNPVIGSGCRSRSHYATYCQHLLSSRIQKGSLVVGTTLFCYCCYSKYCRYCYHYHYYCSTTAETIINVTIITFLPHELSFLTVKYHCLIQIKSLTTEQIFTRLVNFWNRISKVFSTAFQTLFTKNAIDEATVLFRGFLERDVTLKIFHEFWLFLQILRT